MSPLRTLLSVALIALVAATAAWLWLHGGADGVLRGGARDGGYSERAARSSTERGEPLRYDTEYPTMHYATARRTDPIAKLEARLKSGEIALEPGPRGYLDSLLGALDVDASSQTLVFSQTSLQSRRINPRAPRAIYFNDDVYVAWVQSGPLEIASLDPNLGPVFYLLEQPEGAAARAPQFERELGRCLSCHDSYSLSGGGVP